MEMEGSFRFWTLPDGRLLGSLPSQSDILCAALGARNGLLITVDDRGLIQSWAAPTGTHVRDLGATLGTATACAVSQSNRWVSVVDKLGTLALFELSSDKQLPPMAVNGPLQDCCWLQNDLICAGGQGGGYLFRITHVDSP
jgi:hypothetical protein